MKSLIRLILVAAFVLPLQSFGAQQAAPEKGKTEQHVKPATTMKVHIAFVEREGAKTVASLPYTFGVVVDDRPSGRYSVNLRNGVRVPVEIDSKDQKTTYIDVGISIDCGVRMEEDGRYRLSLNFDRSALYPNKSGDGERLVSEPNGAPLVRQFRFSQEVVMKDGQTTEILLSTDPLSGHEQNVVISLNAVK